MSPTDDTHHILRCMAVAGSTGHYNNSPQAGCCTIQHIAVLLAVLPTAD